MTKVQSIISSMIILIVVFASILQFHHHDQKGMICLTDNNANALVENNILDNLHATNCCQAPEDHHKDDDENCSLKISIAKANKSFSLNEHQFAFTILHDIISLCSIDESVDSQAFEIREYNFTLPTATVSTRQLRAPPIV